MLKGLDFFLWNILKDEMWVPKLYFMELILYFLANIPKKTMFYGNELLLMFYIYAIFLGLSLAFTLLYFFHIILINVFRGKAAFIHPFIYILFILNMGIKVNFLPLNMKIFWLKALLMMKVRNVWKYVKSFWKAIFESLY